MFSKLTKIITLMVVTVISNISVAQAPDTLWTMLYGDMIKDYNCTNIIETDSNDFLIIGRSFEYSTSFSKLFFLKIDGNGNILWAKESIECDAIYSATKTYDSNYIISATKEGLIYLVKINTNGDTLKTNTYFEGQGYGIVETENKEYVIAGRFAEGSNDKIFLMKVDSMGTELWTKVFDGLLDDVAYRLKKTVDDEFIIFGYTASFGNGWNDVYLIKTNSDGDSLWAKTYGGLDYDVGRDIQILPDNGFIIVSQSNSFGQGSYDIWLIRTNSQGDTIWTKTIGEDGAERGRSIAVDSEGSFIITGTTTSVGAGAEDIFIMKVDENGNKNWEKIFGWQNDEKAREVRITENGDYIIAGGTESLFNGNNALYIIRIKQDISAIEDDEENISPIEFLLIQNYPNPFNPTTKIKYQIPELSFVTLKVYDVLGTEVATLVNEEKPAGEYNVEFRIDNLELSSGIYFYQLRAGNFVETKKMVLIR